MAFGDNASNNTLSASRYNISLRRLAAPICSLAEKHRIEGVSDEERRIFATGAYYGLDKVSRALYAAPSWAEKVYEKIKDGKILPPLYF